MTKHTTHQPTVVVISGTDPAHASRIVAAVLGVEGPKPEIVGADGPSSFQEFMQALTGRREPFQYKMAPIEIAPIFDPEHYDPAAEFELPQVWSIDIDAYMVKYAQKYPDNERTVTASWLIEALGNHPVIHSYMLVLRRLDGPDAPRIVDGATHMVEVYGLDPDMDREELITGKDAPSLALQTYVGQIVAASDADAIERCMDALKDIRDEVLDLEEDDVSGWVERFGDNFKGASLITKQPKSEPAAEGEAEPS